MADETNGWVATQILVVSDVARSRDWWTHVLGAELYREYGGTSVVLHFAQTWVLLVTGGDPTPDKPSVTMAPPLSGSTVNHAITVRVPDCQAAYEALRERGGEFLTPPYDWGGEIRCFLPDPDGHLIELSEARTGGRAPMRMASIDFRPPHPNRHRRGETTMRTRQG